MFYIKIARPPEFIYFLTYSKRVILLLYFVDFLNKVKFFFHSEEVYVLSWFFGGWVWGI